MDEEIPADNGEQKDHSNGTESGAGAGAGEGAAGETLDSILGAAESDEIEAKDTIFPEGVDKHDESLAYEKNRLSDEEMLKAVNLDIDFAARHAADVNFLERTRYIPLRLTFKERKYLRLVEAALNVSEYTDKVDALVGWRDSRSSRIHTQVKDICAILTGLMVAHDYTAGQRLLKKRDFAVNARYFQTVFELARRYKTLNPERMRSSYGKLLYLLQDCRIPRITELVGFDPVVPLHTVYTFLEARGALAMLEDRLMFVATQEVADDKTKSRAEIQHMIQQKNKARKFLMRKYASRVLSADDIENCLASISDNSSFLLANRDPVDRMLDLLHGNFSADGTSDPRLSLGIHFGSGGARLSHSHTRQFAYVFQTFSLWRTILNDFYRLWFCAEADLLDPASPYRLRDTGQGLNRVQAAPRVRDAMAGILGKVQKQTGHWVGSSVVHLGDHNVPNAFIFLDKYTQISRILNPIVKVIELIPRICRDDPGIRAYVEGTFGGVDAARLMILVDFLRHGFDGSGSDNFFDAGSCIDGRLTSAWNWCSRIEKKPYYPLFLLCRFTGFDGDVKEG